MGIQGIEQKKKKKEEEAIAYIYWTDSYNNGLNPIRNKGGQPPPSLDKTFNRAPSEEELLMLRQE